MYLQYVLILLKDLPIQYEYTKKNTMKKLSLKPVIV